MTSLDEFRAQLTEDGNGQASSNGAVKSDEPPHTPPPDDRVSANGGPPSMVWALTDLGNAERFTHYHGDRVIYVPELTQWRYWDGTKWVADPDMVRTETLAQEVVRRIPEEIPFAESSKHMEAIEGHARKSESGKHIREMVKQARTKLHKSVENFDTRRDLLTCANGTVNLRTGELQPHHPQDYITKSTGMAYEPLSPDNYPYVWEEFLRTIMCDRDHLVDFLQRAIGYSLTGQTGEELMFLMWGRGKNGKTEFRRVLEGIMGGYARAAAPQAFTQNGYRDPTGDYNLAQLIGARMVSTGETEAGHKLKAAVVKQLTSGERMVLREIRKAPIEATPQMKIWMATNHKPSVQGGDEGIWRRMCLIPFEYWVPKSDRVKNYGDKILAKEGPAILAWAVEGARRYYAAEDIGEVPDEVRLATRDYRETEDEFAAFLEECTEEGDEVLFAELYDAYKRWCDENGHTAWSGTAVGKELHDRGFERGQDPNTRARTYGGMKLRQRWQRRTPT